MQVYPTLKKLNSFWNKYSYLEIINISHVGNKNFQWEYNYKCIIKTSVRIIQHLLHEGVVWEFLSIHSFIINTLQYVQHVAKQNNLIFFTLILLSMDHRLEFHIYSQVPSLNEKFIRERFLFAKFLLYPIFQILGTLLVLSKYLLNRWKWSQGI